jgi:hypothetical protein
VIESTQDYFGAKSLKYMRKRIASPLWKYQLKYSTKMTKRCANDVAKIEKFQADLLESTEVIAKKMTTAKLSFSKESTKDYVAWNCKAMYPKPKLAEIKLPKWLGGITAVAKKGFSIYNMVKQYIPGGTKAGAGAVPGSDEMEYEEIEMIGFKEVEGFGKLLKEKLDE